LNGNSLIILNMNIAHYGNAGYAQHEERRVKTLLLQQTEIDRL